MVHMFRGRRWQIKEIPKKLRRYGDCDDPRVNGKAIRVALARRDKKGLSALIHECLHACFWDLEELAVDKAGEDIADFLWRLNWRKQK
jgi:hypothetical protein